MTKIMLEELKRDRTEEELLKEMQEEDQEIEAMLESGYLDDAFVELQEKVASERQAINLKIQKQTVIKLKNIAKENDIPYQTLVGVILRRYVDGKLVATSPLV